MDQVIQKKGRLLARRWINGRKTLKYNKWSRSWLMKKAYSVTITERCFMVAFCIVHAFMIQLSNLLDQRVNCNPSLTRQVTISAGICLVQKKHLYTRHKWCVWKDFCSPPPVRPRVAPCTGSDSARKEHLRIRWPLLSIVLSPLLSRLFTLKLSSILMTSD